MHRIRNNDEHGFIDVTIEGFFSLADFYAFTADLRTAIAAFPNRGKPPATLYDFTNASIQTQEVVAAMKRLAEHPAMTHRRVAFYTEGVLARLQVKRIAENRPNMRIFDNRADGVAWIVAAAEAAQQTIAPPQTAR